MTSPPRLRINVLANALGRFSSMALAVLFTPFYIHFLGVEAYGLIGFYITLQASISFLEMGLSRACNRELARYSGQGQTSHQSMLDTLRSLEVIYWIVAVFLGIVLMAISSWIASSWLNSVEFSIQELTQILILAAWVIALRWPVGLYSGALMGLQRQVLMNVIQVAISVLNWGGSAAVLWLLRPDILLFFQWQLFVALCASVTFAGFAWYTMPGSFTSGRFSLSVIKGVIPFAVGVGGNAVLGMILRQADKLILSAMLPLKQFAYYALASVIASVVSMLAAPVSNAVFPRFSQLVGSTVSDYRLSSLYHLSCQAVAVIVIPFALLIAVFSHEILYVYTGSNDIASSTAVVLTILVIAMMLRASMIVPYAMQLAVGWVKLTLYINAVSVLWLVPAVYFLADAYGPIGAALAWLLVTIAYLVVGMPLMHRRLLVGECRQWMWRSIVAPAISASAFLLFTRWLLDDFPSDRWAQFFLLLVIGVVSLMLAALSAYDVRNWVWRQVSNRSIY